MKKISIRNLDKEGHEFFFRWESNTQEWRAYVFLGVQKTGYLNQPLEYWAEAAYGTTQNVCTYGTKYHWPKISRPLASFLCNFDKCFNTNFRDKLINLLPKAPKYITLYPDEHVLV